MISRLLSLLEASEHATVTWQEVVLICVSLVFLATVGVVLILVAQGGP